MKTRKQNQPMKVYGVVYPDADDSPDTVSIRFSFNAANDQEAARKAAAWNRYHSFTGSDAHTCRELDPQSVEATWLHNEWMH